MSLGHNTLVLSNTRFSLGFNLLVEHETEVEHEIEVVRELKDNLSSWEELGFYFQDMDTEILKEELRDLKDNAAKDIDKARNIILLFGNEKLSNLQTIKLKAEKLATRLLRYYPRVIRQKESLLSKAYQRRRLVKQLLSEDTFDRLSRSTVFGDEGFLLNEVLKELVEQLDEQQAGNVWKLCTLLEEVEWGTQTASTINIEGFDRVYDFLMSIFERATGYDFYKGSWTGDRGQVSYESESMVEEIARKARLALMELLDEWERENESNGED